jgi:pyridoxal phosphate enzyme (YggS family)
MFAEAKARLESIRTRIARSAALAGRSAEDVTLLAVSKTHPAESIRPLLEAGHRRFAENRVQEAYAKWPPLLADFPDVELDLVGQLQSNKAQDAVSFFGAIHSVDRASLVEAIARAQERTGRRPRCFLQVNIGDEPQKGGCPIAELPKLVEQARFAGLNVAGLMAVPPAEVEAAPYFALLAKLAGDQGLAGLSMGMTADFETAVMLGATEVRIGSALCGQRA